MKVENEYKITKLGEIPSDWEFGNLESITVEHKQGYYTKEAYSNIGTKLIRITDLRNQTINYDDMPNLEISVADYEAYKLKSGDFLFARSGAIGRYGIVRKFDEKAIFASYIIRFRFNQKKALNDFIGYFYQSYYSKRQLSKITQGSSNININANNIKSLQIPLPPIKEQQKIVVILSTVDEEIELTNQLIEKTKKLKKGLMQQLLTKGINHTKFKQTELGEIPYDWEIVTFEEIMILQRGFDLPTQSRITGDISIVSSNGVSGTHNKAKVKAPGIITGRSGTIGKVHYIEEDFWPLNTTLFVKKLYDNDPKFLYYFLDGFGLKKFSTGTGVPTLNRNDVHIQKVILPKTKKEQQKIADILSSVDEDIEGYMQEKSKYEKLKKGLMQQLLTGKIRVKVD